MPVILPRLLTRPRPIIQPKLSRLLPFFWARQPELIVKPLRSTCTQVFRFNLIERPDTPTFTCGRVEFIVEVGDDAFRKEEENAVENGLVHSNEKS